MEFSDFFWHREARRENWGAGRWRFEPKDAEEAEGWRRRDKESRSRHRVIARSRVGKNDEAEDRKVSPVQFVANAKGNPAAAWVATALCRQGRLPGGG